MPFYLFLLMIKLTKNLLNYILEINKKAIEIVKIAGKCGVNYYFNDRDMSIIQKG